MRRMVWLAFVIVGCSCRDELPAPPPTSAPTPQASIAAARPVSTQAAFDLVTGTAGTFLVWGVPVTNGGGVRVLEVGPGGAARGSESDIAAGSVAAPNTGGGSANTVLEVAAAVSADHLGIAWSVMSGSTTQVEAAYSAAAPAFAPSVPLGDMEPGVRGRGNVLVSPLADGGLYVAHRITRGACHDTSAGTVDCARFARSRLPTGDSVRGDGASEIAVACSPLLPGAIQGSSRGGAWFYGVCHGSDVPTTTVFVINPDPASQYAAATEVLAGCVPASLARAESGVIVRARCRDDEAVARVDALGHTTHELRHAAFSARCDDGRPTLEARDQGELLAHRLTESESRIEAWLAESMAPPGSRAVWTGDAVLVATPHGPTSALEVQLRRFECRGAELVRTSAPPP